jgi:hypothetical protein
MEAYMRRKDTRLYNVLFPIWLLVWIPSPLWILLIPANYFIDRAVLSFSLKDMQDRKDFLAACSWKICAAGFAADFAGAAFLLAVMLLSDKLGWSSADLIGQGLSMDPFASVPAFTVTLLSVLLAGVVIFLLDRRILTRAGLENDQARRSALILAAATAPYLYFLPSKIIY